MRCEIERERQVAACQVPALTYLDAYEKAERLMKAGKRQVFCKTCQRWKWPDELCELAVWDGQPDLSKDTGKIDTSR